MELPRQIVVGEKNIHDVGDFLKSLSRPTKVSIISGKNVKKIIGKKIDDSLKKSKIRRVWHLAVSNHITALKETEKKVRSDKSDLIVGLGGGRSVDVAKLCSFNLKIPFVSIPTSASHDGIASPFVSIRDKKPHSLVATAPLGVFVDVDIIKRAPRKLIASGCGDLMAKITAVKDWKKFKEAVTQIDDLLKQGKLKLDGKQKTIFESNKNILSYIKQKQSLDGGRIGEAIDLDGAATYFMSDKSSFTTGQVLSIDGGWSVNG